MADFMIHFLFCNVLICLIIGILLGVKRLSRPLLTSRMQYTIWFLLFGCLAAPFLPARSARFLPHFSWFENVSDVSSDSLAYASRNIAGAQAVSANWMNDFSVSVMEHSSPAIGSVLSAVWIAGVLFMLFFTVRSRICLHALQKNAQPLDGVCKTIHGIYLDCLAEMNLKKPVPIYAVDRLASPIMTGLFRPRIYVPLHLVSGFCSSEIRYILLLELHYFRCKDALVNDLMAAAGIVYWFNPLLWYAWKLIRTDREIACDSSVLKMLEEDAYIEYGNTLIHFAEKISFTPFLFSSGIGGNAVQIKKRILNIAGYRPAAVGRRLTGFLACVLTAALLAGFLPALTSKAADSESYTYEDGGRNVSALDLSETFGSYNGSFVLYDAGADSWQIYNEAQATARISPASTYKIYSALHGLQAGIISGEDSRISWNGQDNYYDTWNQDQTLESAMADSVTWYFQEIDRRLGLSSIQDYVREIGYGNETVGDDPSDYWYDSSLKISPIEQVELLEKFYNNEFGFSPENIQTVKDSIRLYSGQDGVLYGKTGTQASGGENVCGWFIGFIETGGNTLFFASNIQAGENASGAAAVELTFSVLSGLEVWEQGA